MRQSFPAELLLQQIAAGIASGGIYASLALALVVVYQATRSVNLAQGEMATFSTFGAWQLMRWGVPYWAAFPTVVVASFAAGYGLQRFGLSRLERASMLTRVAALLALFAAINGLSAVLWGYDAKPFPSPFGTRGVIGTRLVSAHHLGMMGVTALLLGMAHLLFRHTRVGLAMRAAADAPASAPLVGIPVAVTRALGWGVATAMGAVAGMLVAPLLFLEPNMMMGVLLYAFAAAVLGGITSPVGAVGGGLVLGVVENVAGTFVPHVGRELKVPAALAVVIVLLVVRSSPAARRRPEGTR